MDMSRSAFAIAFAVGLATVGGYTHADDPPTPRHFVMTGILGGFTTFSSFSLQTLTLAREGEWFRAGANIVGSVVLCLLAVWLGHMAGLAVNSLKGS